MTMCAATPAVPAEVEAAIGWWGEQVAGPLARNNGDDLQSIMLMLVAAKAPVPGEEEVRRFAEELRARWRERHARAWAGGRSFVWSCDCGPGADLFEAAAAAGIDARNFPVKTVCWVEPGRVAVARGYRAPIVALYPPAATGEEGRG